MSETTNLKLKKHDNPETNTERFDIDNYLNGNWDKIDENVGEFNTEISNINSKNTELEKELKEAQEDFYQASVRGQASGEYIHVEDSSNCRAKIGIGGNSEQETRSGKNYYFIDDVETTTMSGVTYSIKKGLITLNGTATNTFAIKSSTKFSLSNEDYIISATKIQGSFSGIIGKYVDKDSNIIIDGGLIGNTIKKKLTSDYTGLTTYLYIQKGAVCNNYQVKIQLEKGTEISEWEQAGAMPSPDYSSEIKTVGSNMNLIEETFKGYNLNANGALEVSSSFNMQIAKVKANVIYTLNTITNVLGYYNEKPTLTSVTYNKSRTVLSGNTNTIVATRDGYIAIRTMDAEKVKCVEGTEVGEYSKYGQGCVKVTKCNKNLFDKNTTIDGKYIGSNGSIQTQSNIMYSDYIQIKTNINYYITGRSEWSSVVLYDKSKTFLERISTTQPNGVLNITNSNCKYIIINALLTNKDTLQLEEGASTSYEPHQEQSYIIPTQREMLEDDYFDWDNEEEVHTWNKLVLNGTESWNLASNRFYINLSDVANGVISAQCSHYKETESWEQHVAQNENFIVYKAPEWANGRISIIDSRYTTVSTFQAWLKSQYDAGTPVVIYYKLATPTRIAFTDEQKAVAKELNNARTYKNVTNIYSTDEISPIIDLDYAKDLETLLNNTQALAVNNASEGV